MAERYDGPDRRRTRVVFPSGDARVVWGAVVAVFLSWAAWLSSRVVENQVQAARAACVAGNSAGESLREEQKR